MRAPQIAVVAVAAAAALVLAGCVPGGPSAPTAQQITDEFDELIQPAWAVEVPGIYGQAAVADGLVAVYAIDEADGMRLEVRDTMTGDLVWEHVASPGGAWGAPLFSETDSASRPYPIPSIRPFVVDRGEGEDAAPVVIFAERELTETNEIFNPDYLRVADLRTGELIELTAPDYVQYESEFGDALVDDDGNLVIEPRSPFRICGDGAVCFEASNNGFYVVDVESGEVTNTPPEWDDFAEPQPGYSRDWGAEYVQVVRDDLDDRTVARLVDGEEVWIEGTNEIFGDDRAQPAELRDFALVGDLLLVQGYGTSMQNTDDQTLRYSYVSSRHLTALDPDTGDVVWQAHDVDRLCYAVLDRPLPTEPGVIPVCHVTAGSFLFSFPENAMLEHEDAVATIAGLDLATGELTWEVDDAGTQAVMHHGREMSFGYASGPGFAVTDTTPTGDYAESPNDPTPVVVDLKTGEAKPIADAAESAFVCEAERPGVKPEFQGSVFVGGSNPIALEYPGGFFDFPCTPSGEADGDWSKGAVRAAGTPAGEQRVLIVTEDGLAGFEL